MENTAPICGEMIMRKVKSMILMGLLAAVAAFFVLQAWFEAKNIVTFQSAEEALNTYTIENCAVLQQIPMDADSIVLLYDRNTHGVFFITIKKQKNGYVLENQSPQCAVGINEWVEMNYTNGEHRLILKAAKQTETSGTGVPQFEISYGFQYT